MKLGIVCKILILGLTLSLAASAFAATTGTLELNRAVTVNGTELKAGVYKIHWEGSGPNMELSIMQGKTVLAKVPAHFVAQELPAAYDAAVTRENGNGSDSFDRRPISGKETFT